MEEIKNIDMPNDNFNGTGNDDEYEALLSEIRKDTLDVFNSTDLHDLRADITYDLEGVEFRLSDEDHNKREKYQKYSHSTRSSVFEATALKGIKENSTWRFVHDFENAKLKFGCLVQQFVCASPVLDLEYLMELFASQDIPCYIEDNKVFHMNAVEPKVEEVKTEYVPKRPVQ